MWIFCRRGFYSVVEDQDDPRYLIVRARVAGDIQQTWPKAKVTETPDSGYRYRAHIQRDAVGKAIAEVVTDTDYIKLQEQHRG
jgi:hypothetical protein